MVNVMQWVVHGSNVDPRLAGQQQNISNSSVVVWCSAAFSLDKLGIVQSENFKEHLC